ncbi:transposase [Agarilytica rhodophyticola]|uniref:transposase n=1 Tax=Agarilytica rhodophyticola TaxID=1737490 RepID=UPI000B348346|nr:transposase [Agarilytica rhodophyticola]
MSQKSKKIYSPEFKESAIKLALESDQPVAQTVRELGISSSTLHNWIHSYTKRVSGQDTRTDDHLYEGLKRLKKENARLKEEREIFKKNRCILPKKHGKIRLD